MKLSLLVATPQLTGSFFGQAVVLLLEQETSGALGLVINRPAGMTLADVAPELSNLQPLTAQATAQDIFLGGPVETTGGWCLYRTPTGYSHEVELATNLWLSREMPVLEVLVSSGQEFRLLLGYAGWSAGQVQQEIQAGAWVWGEVSAAEFEALLWRTPTQECWTQALRRLGLSKAALAGSVARA